MTAFTKRFLRPRRPLTRKTHGARGRRYLLLGSVASAMFLVLLTVALSFLYRTLNQLEDRAGLLRDVVPTLNRKALESIVERARLTPEPPPVSSPPALPLPPFLGAELVRPL